MPDHSRPPKNGGAGQAVDAKGGVAFDPSENVKDLSEAATKRQDDLRNANNQYLDARIKCMEEMAILRADHAKEIRQLESDRLDKIRQVDVLAGNTAADRALVAIQTLATSQAAAAETLRSMVSTTATTIATQTANAMDTVTKRIAALEQVAAEGRGSKAIADPMMEKLVQRMDSLLETRGVASGKTEGISMVGAIVMGAATFVAALLAIGAVLWAVLKP